VRDDDSDFDESPGVGAVAEPSNVYFLSLVDPADPDRDFSLVKVGFTTNDVEKRIAQLQRNLDAAMLGNPGGLHDEGRLTDELASLHRVEEIKMRATILLEDCPAIVRVCSYRRSLRLVVKDKKSSTSSGRTEARP
jgi:hypothetical protein